MPRTVRSQSVFFRYDGDTRKDVLWRINPTAIRFQQQGKLSVTETLGGYFYDKIYSSDPQYSALMLPDLTIEGTTGIAYKKELQEVEWIWRHQSDIKSDGKPVDIYFFNLVEVGAHQGIDRDYQQGWLISIMNFAWDDTVQSPYEIKFSFRFKVLRDLFWEVSTPPADFTQIPNIENARVADSTADRPDGDFVLPGTLEGGEARTIQVPGLNF